MKNKKGVKHIIKQEKEVEVYPQEAFAIMGWNGKFVSQGDLAKPAYVMNIFAKEKDAIKRLGDTQSNMVIPVRIVPLPLKKKSSPKHQRTV